MENNNYEILQRWHHTGHAHIHELAQSQVIDIPALQRSLVWRPAQVELLWDSILRGFPIGGFILTEGKDKDGNGCFQLMDGQQRYNTLCLAFSGDRANRSRLWIDIAPKAIKNTTRKFWLRVTTLAHPWGYHRNDECSPLNAHEKREAMKCFGFKAFSLYQKELSLSDTWPVCSVCPVPISILMAHAQLDDAQAFAQQCYNELLTQNERFIEWLFDADRHGLTEDVVKQALITIHPIIKKAFSEYYIPFSFLESNVLENENESKTDRSEATDLEILFQRITTGGTRISASELNYSAIKAYWPEIKDICESLSLQCVPAHYLANMAFRLYKIINDPKKEWQRDNLQLKYIRNLSLTDYTKVNKFFTETLPHLVPCVNEWLCEGEYGVPPFIRTSIARQTPEIYLFLLWVAYTHPNADTKHITATALFLKWLVDDKNGVIAKIYKTCSNEGFSKESIFKGLCACSKEGYQINWPCSEEVLEREIRSIPLRNDWRHWKIWSQPHSQIWELLRYYPADFPDILLYAERKYLNSRFPNYDPSRTDMWEKANRPWDYDHILPHDWVYNRKSGKYREFCREWLNVTGNLAAIPFEVNRAKSNSDNWSYYEQHADELYYQPMNRFNSDIIHQEDLSVEFAETTLRRTLSIYNEAYQILKEVCCNMDESILPEDVLQRKKRMEAVIEQCQSKNLHVKPCYHDRRTDRDFFIDRLHDWAMRWTGVVVVSESRIVVCASMNSDSTIRVGYRLAMSLSEKMPSDIEFVRSIAYPTEGYNFTDDNRWIFSKNLAATALHECANEMHNLTATLSQATPPTSL